MQDQAIELHRTGTATPAHSDLLHRKTTGFVLWRPGSTRPAPVLVIGQFRDDNPSGFTLTHRLPLRPDADVEELWVLPAADCGLDEGQVYHYWFEVSDTHPERQPGTPILCTDPTAWTVDWRLLAPRLPAPYGENDRDPAGVVKFEDGRLVPCDPGGEVADWDGDRPMADLPPNNRLVIYELPTTWAMFEESEAGAQLAVGTFRDVMALVDRNRQPANARSLAELPGQAAHLSELGVNALELLPPADSFVDREWGYATSNYFAADHDLGFPKRHHSPTASTDLSDLVKLCHRKGIRFFTDIVMAFANRYSYENVNFPDFHVRAGVGDPDEVHDGQTRDAFGGTLFRYRTVIDDAYDPVSGAVKSLVAARQLMQAHLVRWMMDFRIDGVRLDSVVNYGTWDFIQEFNDHGRRLWNARWAENRQPAGQADARFLTIAEELAVPVDLVRQGRCDALWNENFKRMVRYAIMGRNDNSEPSFEWTIRKMIDCRLLGFSDGAQAVNYVTSHDVEGFRNERLFNLLVNNGVPDAERRIKLAFACLMTSVGIPMIFAGEEFADQHDLLVLHPHKQVDPVNFDRREEPWRRRVFDYVGRLVRFRTRSDALAVNDTYFIHVDFDDGKRIVVWQRGAIGSGELVVVVANFSDFGTPDPFNPQSVYV
ncbi:alpha-amylase family glycosyl hydrolase, partial [Skermanella stibiiresistens]|uniref:alpha-amylase family glycosyl hydrolase n=1 Tax=Skermanella stibiiresistens TaxID=913326 RepID=UPI000688B342